MTSALVVAGRGSGLSTFFGLLYTAEVRLGSEEADEFRFHVDRESIQRLGGIYGELGDGRFPESEVDWQRSPLTFLFARRRSPLGRLRGGAAADGEFVPFPVEIGGIPIDEVAELAERDAVLDPTTRRLLGSPIVLGLIAATDLPTTDERPPQLVEEDRRLATALGLVLRFRAGARRRAARHLFPIFVMTKWDRVAPAAAERLRLPPGPTIAWAASARADLAARLTSTVLPATAAVLSSPPDRRVSVAPAEWFFSEVATEPGDPHRVRRRWRTPVGGWEPDYPYGEYHALLERMGELAVRLPASDDA